MRISNYLLLLSSFLYLELALASSNIDIDKTCPTLLAKTLKEHVVYLSSDALEGRLTGSKGEHLATQYVAQIFSCLGLEPAGDNGSFFQEFAFTSSVSYGQNNLLSISSQQEKSKKLNLDQEWRPLSFSDSGVVKASELVFAGYGITAPAKGKLQPYDSYRHLNVKGKWVVVFRNIPEKISAEQTRHLNQYASSRYKAFTAKEHGAKGIIFISGPNSRVKQQLIPLASNASLSSAGIIALSVQNKAFEALITNHQLKLVQSQLDSGALDVPLDLNNIQLTGQVVLKRVKKQGRNVLAKMRLNSSNSPMIIVGAHGDHLGYGELGNSRARENEKGMIHYGADDNASGVANILKTAITLSQMKHKNLLHSSKDLFFAIWSGEELGLLGSSYFVQDFMKKTKDQPLHHYIYAAINLDMVGRLEKDLIIQGTASSKSWSSLIKKANKQQALSLVMQKDPYLPTDSLSFYLHEVPSINLFTGSHDEYHTTRDRPEVLNYEGMNTISQFLVRLIQAQLQSTSPLDFSYVAKAPNNHRGHFKVYLGTIPDYASTDQVGVKLSGVSKNSPAERAGVQTGDVIIELAGKKIVDIYDYTFILTGLHAGESTPLVIRRGGKKINLTVIIQARE